MEKIKIFLFEIVRQLCISGKISIKYIIITLSVALIILLTGFQVSNSLDISMEYLTGDVSTVLNGDFYAGIISSIGILLWIGTGLVCLFTYKLYKPFDSKNPRGFILFSGLIVLVLGIDDLILFHEKIFLRTFHLNEVFWFGFYMIVIAYYLVRYKTILIESNQVILFFLALVFFATSIVMDKNVFGISKELNIYFVLEDGTKLTGIIFWSVFLIDYCYKALFDKLKNQSKS